MHSALQTILFRISRTLVVCAHTTRYLLSRGKLVGVRIVVITTSKVGEESVLLVRPLYAPGIWTLPGGGVDHGETSSAAASRELFEETGLTTEENTLIHIATHKGLFGTHDTVDVFFAPQTTGTLAATPDWEILERRFFPVDAFPLSLLENHAHFIQEALRNRSAQ